MKHLVDHLSGWFAVGMWLAGTVTAKAGWSTFFACVCPPYAWYLLVERLLQP